MLLQWSRGGAQPFICKIHHIHNRKTRKNKKQDNRNPTQLYFHLLLQLPLQKGNSCTAVSCTNQTTTKESGQCLSACYSLIFCQETLGTAIHVDVILTCSTHLIDAANQAHTPKSMTLTNNLHQQCTTTHTSKRSTILQPTGPKKSTAGHQRSLKEDVWQYVNRCTTNRSKPL